MKKINVIAKPGDTYKLKLRTYIFFINRLFELFENKIKEGHTIVINRLFVDVFYYYVRIHSVNGCSEFDL